jgi:hypothetical protein
MSSLECFGPHLLFFWMKCLWVFAAGHRPKGMWAEWESTALLSQLKIHLGTNNIATYIGGKTKAHWVAGPGRNRQSLPQSCLIPGSKPSERSKSPLHLLCLSEATLSSAVDQQAAQGSKLSCVPFMWKSLKISLSAPYCDPGVESITRPTTWNKGKAKTPMIPLQSKVGTWWRGQDLLEPEQHSPILLGQVW